MIYHDEKSCQVAYNILTLYARKHVVDWVDISIERLKSINKRDTFNEITLLLYIAKYDYSKDIVPLQEKEIISKKEAISVLTKIKALKFRVSKRLEEKFLVAIG